MTSPPGSLEEQYEHFVRAVPAHRGSFADLPWRWFEGGPATGLRAARAVVIFPGAVGGADIFFLLFQRLAAHGRVLAIDLPSTADADRALEGCAALLESRGVGDATLLGASFSGLFVQAFASRFPSRTRALILSHTAAPDPARAARERRAASIARRVPMPVMRGVLKLAVTLLLRRVPEKALWSRLYCDALDALSRDDLVDRYLLAASLEEASRVRSESSRAADAWTGPVLIIHSDNDAIAKPVEQAKLRALYPGAAWHPFEGTGHSTYAMKPFEYSDAIASFVGSNWGQTHV